MGKEIDLLREYPKSKRDITKRLVEKDQKIRTIARKFGKEFFDGERKYGYGGFNYNPKYWQPVIPTLKKHYNLNRHSKILDIGCAKGFLLVDLIKAIPGISVSGIDISQYAIKNCHPDISQSVSVGDARSLPYEDSSFDLVLSINTLHNLEINELSKSLKEIERVSSKNSFITVDAYRNTKEKTNMESWNLTAKTMLHVDEWKKLFESSGYKGDYYWFIP